MQDDAIARLRRRLLAVLLCDATAVAALGVVAVVARSRPSGTAYAAIARTATASLLPGVLAVALEQRAHRPGPRRPHRMRGSVVLLAAGLLVNTAGTVAVLRRTGPRGCGVRPTAFALLIGGDAIGVPYLRRIRALHR